MHFSKSNSKNIRFYSKYSISLKLFYYINLIYFINRVTWDIDTKPPNNRTQSNIKWTNKIENWKRDKRKGANYKRKSIGLNLWKKIGEKVWELATVLYFI